MISHNRETMFGNQVFGLDDQGLLPVFSDKARREFIQGETIHEKISYLYNPDRAKRHFNAQALIQALYHVGAELINNNMAYAAPLEHQLTDADQQVDSLPQASQIREKLMAAYRALPDSHSRNGHVISKNPLHALFVTKVALDHLSPERIYDFFIMLGKDSLKLTVNNHRVELPNKSQFINDHAAHLLIEGYIKNNLQRFSFLSDKEKTAFLQSNTYYMLLCGPQYDEFKPMVDAILSADLSKQEWNLTHPQSAIVDEAQEKNDCMIM